MEPGKGQASVETMLVFTALTALFIIIFFTALETYTDRRTTVQRGEARTTVEKLGGTVDELCRLPRGTKDTVHVPVPELVDLGQSSISEERIEFRLANDEINETVFAATDCAVTGELPGRSGTYRFQVKRRKTDVLVNWTVIS